MDKNNEGNSGKEKMFWPAVGTLIFTFFSNLFSHATLITLTIIIFYFIDFNSIAISYAGKETVQDLSYSLSFNEASKVVNDSLIYIIIAQILVILALCIWVYFERQLRYRVIKDLGSRNSELEKLVDNNKGTSSLTPSGTTNKKDKL